MGSVPAAPRQNPYFRLHCVNIFVRDQDRSLRFYVDQLGFHLAFDAKLQSGERWVAVAPPDGTAILALVAPKPDSQEYKLIGRATHVVFFTEDVAAKYQEWAKRGVRFLSAPRASSTTPKRRRRMRVTRCCSASRHRFGAECSRGSGTSTEILFRS